MGLVSKSMEELPLILKVEQVAEVLGISRKTAYSLVRSKDFPAVRVGEKRLVIPRDKFLLWLHTKAEQPLD